MSVIVYTAPNCQPCKATIKRLQDKGVQFSTIDLSISQDAINHVKSLGHHNAPVVVTLDGRDWSGFRPDLIDTL